jgi:hypothetical protein
MLIAIQMKKGRVLKILVHLHEWVVVGEFPLLKDRPPRRELLRKLLVHGVPRKVVFKLAGCKSCRVLFIELVMEDDEKIESAGHYTSVIDNILDGLK